MLDNRSGNSHSDDRIALFKKLVEITGVSRIEMLVMDREFIGHDWLCWLKEHKIPFCVRVPKSHNILLPDCQSVKAQELLEERKTFTCQAVVVDRTVVNLSLSYGADGELLYLIGTAQASKLKQIYKKRWSIEVFFQALKGRGFNMEQSCLRCIVKYRKLFAVVSMAYTLCWAAGIEHSRVKPVKRKKHGYPQYSVFRRGLNLIRQCSKNYKNELIETLIKSFIMALDKAQNRIFEQTLKTVGKYLAASF